LPAKKSTKVFQANGTRQLVNGEWTCSVADSSTPSCFMSSAASPATSNTAPAAETTVGGTTAGVDVEHTP